MRRNERGETIVEVLIAIAIVSSVLGIAYSIMNRNLLIMRDNQERSEAVKQAQGQLESLKALWGIPAGRLALDTVGNNGFCINPQGQIVNLAGGAPHADANADGNFEDYHPEEVPENSCRFSNLYYSGIRRELVDGSYRYKIYTRWDKLGGGRNEAILVYRLE